MEISYKITVTFGGVPTWILGRALPENKACDKGGGDLHIFSARSAASSEKATTLIFKIARFAEAPPLEILEQGNSGGGGCGDPACDLEKHFFFRRLRRQIEGIELRSGRFEGGPQLKK